MVSDVNWTFVGSVDKPIKLISSSSGEHVSSYHAYSHVEEITHPTRLALKESLLVGGFDSYVKAWDVRRPGRQAHDIRIGGRNTRGSMSGLVGALCLLEGNTVLAGTYNKHLGIVDLRSKLTSVSPSAVLPRAGGFNQLVSLGGSLVASGHRNDDKFRFWDLRSLTEPIGEVSRQCQGNQCLKMETDGMGSVVYGDVNGNVCLASSKDLQASKCVKMANYAIPFVACDPSRQGLYLFGVGSRSFDHVDSVDDSDSDQSEEKYSMQSSGPRTSYATLKFLRFTDA